MAYRAVRRGRGIDASPRHVITVDYVDSNLNNLLGLNSGRRSEGGNSRKEPNSDTVAANFGYCHRKPGAGGRGSVWVFL